MDDPIAALRAYRAAFGDPDAGRALLALHHPDATIATAAGKQLRAGDVDPAAFAADHEAAALAVRAGAAGLPPDAVEDEAGTAAGSAADPAAGDMAPGRAIAWLRLSAAERPQPFWLTAGLVDGPGGWRVDWVGVDEAPPSRGWDVGKALALAPFALLESQAALPIRGFADVAYRARFHVARPALEILPEAHFGCHGTGTCCTIPWEIDAPPEAQAFIDAIPWETVAPHLVGLKLQPREDGRLRVKPKGAPCTFLDEHTRCRIHALLGTPVFSPCITFPFRFAETPDGVAVATSFHCQTVRSNLGPPLTERHEEIYRRLNQAGLMATPARGFRFDDTGPALPWPVFKGMEDQLKAFLADERFPLHRRLWIASRWLEARRKDEAPDGAAYAAEAIEPFWPYELAVAETYGNFLMGCLAKFGPELAPLATARPKALVPLDPDRVQRWLRMIHHAKDFAYNFDLVTAHSVTVLMYVAVLALEAHHEGPIPEHTWMRLGTYLAHNMLARAFKDIFESADFMRRELANPLAGQLLLRWAAHHAGVAEAAEAG